MITVIFSITVNKVLFFHSHIDSYGRIVYHAHPYNKSGDQAPYKTHHHNNTELIISQSLYNLISSTSIILITAPYIKIKQYFKLKERQYSSDFLSPSAGRSPPTISFSY